MCCRERQAVSHFFVNSFVVRGCCAAADDPRRLSNRWPMRPYCESPLADPRYVSITRLVCSSTRSRWAGRVETRWPAGRYAPRPALICSVSGGASNEPVSCRRARRCTGRRRSERVLSREDVRCCRRTGVHSLYSSNGGRHASHAASSSASALVVSRCTSLRPGDRFSRRRARDSREKADEGRAGRARDGMLETVQDAELSVAVIGRLVGCMPSLVGTRCRLSASGGAHGARAVWRHRKEPQTHGSREITY
jgi:hypothetical protein